MMSERSTTLLRSLHEKHVYPAVLGFLLLVTAIALSTGRIYLGIAGVFFLSLLSLGYGAVQAAEQV